MREEDRRGQGNRSSDRTLLEHTGMVLNSPQPADRQPSGPSSIRQFATSTLDRGTTPSLKENAATNLQIIRTRFLQKNVSSKASEIIICSWADTFLKQYQPYLQTWLKLCCEW